MLNEWDCDWSERELNKEEIVKLLSVDNFSEDFYKLLYASQSYALKNFDRGYIFSQIGLDGNPCKGDCKFCSMAKSGYAMQGSFTRDVNDVLTEIDKAVTKEVSHLFLMTTEGYDRHAFANVVAAAKKKVGERVRIVVNTGDFDSDYAAILKESGAFGAYHIVRLREGTDTNIPVARREKTLDAILSNGLELFYCIEPIGLEHGYEEIAAEIIRAKKMKIRYMAAMRRTAVPGTKKANDGEISDRELAKIAAVTMLAVKPKFSMNVHEPNRLAMLAGINQLYAEYGFNPRDNISDTVKGRGYDAETCAEILRENGWTKI